MLHEKSFIGLKKGSATSSCTNSTCDNQLQWNDDSPFVFDSFYEKEIAYNHANGHDCFSLNTNGEIIDNDCTETLNFFCQLDCSIQGK